MGVLPTMISLGSIPYLPLVGVNRANACVCVCHQIWKLLLNFDTLKGIGALPMLPMRSIFLLTFNACRLIGWACMKSTTCISVSSKPP